MRYLPFAESLLKIAMVRAGLGQSQESGTQLRSPMLVARTQLIELSPAAS